MYSVLYHITISFTTCIWIGWLIVMQVHKCVRFERIQINNYATFYIVLRYLSE